jgi:hypothetical protein
MKYLYILLGCVAMTNAIEAQIYIKPRLIGEFGPGCTNTIVVETDNLTAESRLGTVSGENDVASGDTLTGFCIDSLPAYSAQLYLVAHFFENFDVPLAESPAIPDEFNYEITNVVDPSSINDANGSFVVVFDSILDTAYVHAQSLGWGYPVLTWLDDTHLLVDGIAFGPNYLYFGDTNPDLWEKMYNVMFYIGDPEALQKPHMYAYVSNTGSTDGCQGAAEVISYYTEGPVTYTWNVPGAPNAPSIDSLCPGVYTVIVSDSSLDTMYISFTVFEEYLSAEAVVTDAGDDCTGTVEIVAINVDGAIHYDWSIPGAADAATLDSLCPGDYFVMVTDASGDTTYVNFTIEGQGWRSAAGPGNKQSMQSTVTDEFNIYPNPSSDYLNVTGTGNVVVEMYDAYGKLVRKNNTSRTYVADLAEGVYFVRINGNQKLQRFVKSH